MDYGPQAPLSMGFPRQEYWSELPCPSPRASNPGIKPGSSALQADSFPCEAPGKPWCSHWLVPNVCAEEEERREGYSETLGFSAASGRPHKAILCTCVGQSLGEEDISPG